MPDELADGSIDLDSGIVVFSSTPGDGMAISGAIDLFDRGYMNVRFYKGDLSQLAVLLRKHERDLSRVLVHARHRARRLERAIA